MKVSLRKLVAVVMISALCVASTGCSEKTCDFCGETYTGATYYRGISQSEMDMNSCRDCAAKYWAPLYVENFKKS